MRTPPLGHGAVERHVAGDDVAILCAALGPGAHVVQHVSLVLRRARERVCADRGRRFERAERRNPTEPERRDRTATGRRLLIRPGENSLTVTPRGSSSRTRTKRHGWVENAAGKRLLIRQPDQTR